ncbi:MAG: N-formylglutamate amidohydrolase, partial [Verrucomicrobia bacterium]|nr:N-formylglutamate amidohydrolase [Verrucomicrobiota bacterium]
VLDIHTYNHRRNGPDGEPADPAANPEVNIGTGTMDREQWAPLADRFITDLRSFDLNGRHLDVRENVKFRGGFFSRFIHEHFPKSGCSLAIEFKKFFMNEWTGELDNAMHDQIREALASAVPGLLDML